MTAHYLVFPIQQEADQTLGMLYSKDGEMVTDGLHHALYVIGTLYKEVIMNMGDEEPTPPVALTGWHVNLRLDGELPESLRPFEVHPVTPSVVWL